MSRVIALTSGKGGVGKSSVCVNLGSVLANMGFKVCLIDVDLGLKNLDVMMGLENRVIYDLKDVMEGKCHLKNAILKDKYNASLFLLPACKSVNLTKFKRNDLKIVVDELKTTFDYILLDTPAGIETGFYDAISIAEEIIVVATLDITSLQDADRVIGILMKENLSKISLVLNKVNLNYINNGISIKIKDALDWLSLPLLSIIYDDTQLIKSNNRGIPIALNHESFSYECFNVMAKRLNGESVELLKPKDVSFIKRLFKTK
ncbi:MAG: septum site-determining protein MinD [Erysipelotrichaceae bacterium]